MNDLEQLKFTLSTKQKTSRRNATNIHLKKRNNEFTY